MKPRIFNISIDYSSFNIFSSSFLDLLQIINNDNVFSKIYDISRFFSFLYLPQILQYNVPGSIFLSYNNFHKKGLGSKTKVKLDYRGFLIVFFQNISFLKEFLECFDYNSSYLPKLK